jgi:hypothetical protein
MKYRMSSGEDIRYQGIFQACNIVFQLKLALFQALDFQLLKGPCLYQMLDRIIEIPVLNLEFDDTFSDVTEFFFG